MKKLVLSFVFLLCLSCNVLAYLLSDGEEVSDFSSLQRYHRQNFSIGFEVSDYLYKEPGLMTLTGTKYGVCAEYVDRRFVSGFERSNILLNVIQFRFMTGDVDYDGHLLDEARTKYKCNSISDWYVEARELSGFVICKGGG